MTSFYATVLSALLSISATPATAQPIIMGSQGQIMDTYFSSLEGLGVFTGSVLISRNDTVFLSKGYGLANRDRNIRATENTLFVTASVSKQFTATAILKLETEGRLSLQDSIGKFFPSLAGSDKAGITIHHLLNHTSGLIRTFVETKNMLDKKNKHDYLSEIVDSKPEFPAGKNFSYSNVGYNLLAAIVEIVSKKQFTDYLVNDIFLPAGLSNTGFIGDTRWNRSVLAAHGYWNQYDEWHNDKGDFEGSTSWNIIGCGAVYSTPADLFKWFKAFWEGRIIPKNKVDKMLTPGKGESGYGWFIKKREDGSTSILYHNGDLDSYESAIRYYPTTKVFTAIFSSARWHDGGGQQDEYLNNALGLFNKRNVAMPPRPKFISDKIRLDISGDYIDVAGTGNRFTIYKDRSGDHWIGPAQGNKNGWKLFSRQISIDSIKLERATTFVDSVTQAFRKKKNVTTLFSASFSYKHTIGDEWAKALNHLMHIYGNIQKTSFITHLPLFYNSNRVMVFTNLHFAKKNIAVTWLIQGNEIIECWFSGKILHPQGYRIAPLEDGKYIVYDPFESNNLSLQFTNNELVLTAGTKAIELRLKRL